MEVFSFLQEIMTTFARLADGDMIEIEKSARQLTLIDASLDELKAMLGEMDWDEAFHYLADKAKNTSMASMVEIPLVGMVRKITLAVLLM